MLNEHPSAGILTRLASYTPFIFFVLFWGFVFRTRLNLGVWPTYGHPDPKQLGFDLHFELVHLAFFFLVVSVPFFLIFPRVIAPELRRRTKRLFNIYAPGWILLIFSFILTKFYFLSWFLD